MSLFNPKNNTISDRQMADLSRRAQKANKESMFSKRNVEQRKATVAQQRKAKQS